MTVWFINSKQVLSSAVGVNNPVEIIREVQGVLFRHGGFNDFLGNTPNSSQITSATFFIPYSQDGTDKVLTAKNLDIQGCLEKGSDNYGYAMLYLKQCDFIFNVVVNFLAEVKETFVSNSNLIEKNLSKSETKQVFYYFIAENIEEYALHLYNGLGKALIERFGVGTLTETELKQLIYAILEISIGSLSVEVQ